MPKSYLDILEKSIYEEITADMNNMLADSQITVTLSYKNVGDVTISADTFLISETGTTTLTVPAVPGGYGQISRRRIGRGEGDDDSAPGKTFFENMYFLVAKKYIATPQHIDRLTFDGESFQVKTIETDSLNSHWRIEVKRT